MREYLDCPMGGVKIIFGLLFGLAFSGELRDGLADLPVRAESASIQSILPMAVKWRAQLVERIKLASASAIDVVRLRVSANPASAPSFAGEPREGGRVGLLYSLMSLQL